MPAEAEREDGDDGEPRVHADGGRDRDERQGQQEDRLVGGEERPGGDREDARQEHERRPADARLSECEGGVLADDAVEP